MIAHNHSERDALEHLTRALERLDRHDGSFAPESADNLVERAMRVTDGLRTVLGLHRTPDVILAPTFDPSDYTGGE